MGRVIGRLLMGVAGAFSFACYAGVAYLAYRLLRFVVLERPALLVVLPVLLVGSWLLAYRNYRVGARRIAASVPTVDPPADGVATVTDRLDRLCDRMDLEAPTVRFTDLEAPNGFALGGPDGGVVVVDVSLLETLDDDGLEALLAHELAHLERGDGLARVLAFTGVRTAMGVATLALSPGILLLTGVAKASGWLRGDPSTWSRSLAWRLRTAALAVLTVVPAACATVLLERSRRREYAADRRAAAVTGQPTALAAALRAVDDTVPAERRLVGTLPVEEAYAPDVLYRLLSTHPPLEERVARLQGTAE